ncbi:MAG: hypothetical protein DME32_05260, partial [Verrucomicrobia bacterium]
GANRSSIFSTRDNVPGPFCNVVPGSENISMRCSGGRGARASRVLAIASRNRGLPDPFKTTLKFRASRKIVSA